MKPLRDAAHWDQEMSVAIPTARLESVHRALDVSDVARDHADFVWASLHRFGVRSADLPDMLQEVLVVVHRRLHTYDPACQLRAWLFGISLRVAAAYRRRAHNRHERLIGDLPEQSAGNNDPEQAAIASSTRARLEQVLAALTLDKRAVLVMYEIERLTCSEIAEMLAVPLGTVHSRLHSARRDFKRSLARLKVREDRGVQ